MNYKSKAWKQRRAYILKRDGYLCQENKRYGRTVEADTVHHIYPIEEYPELKWENWNLISLSHQAHNEMHNRTDDDVTEKGKYWQRKVRRQYNKWREENE